MGFPSKERYPELYRDKCPLGCINYGLTRTQNGLRFCNSSYRLRNNFGSAERNFLTLTEGESYWDKSHYFGWYKNSFSENDFTRILAIDDFVIRSHIHREPMDAFFTFNSEVFERNKVVSNIHPGIFNEDLFSNGSKKVTGIFYSKLDIPLNLINSTSIDTLFNFKLQEEVDEYVKNINLLS